VADHATYRRTAYRSEGALIGEQRTCHASHSRAAYSTFFLGRHAGATGQSKEQQSACHNMQFVIHHGNLQQQS
jgi:hypothetical protein